LLKEETPFRLVVEPQEADEYGKRYGYEHLLVLPWSGDDAVRRQFCAERGIENGGLVAVRNWIKEHSIAEGHARHWQLDDNIRSFMRRWKATRVYCNSEIALSAVEDWVDRYENIAIAGLNYKMFVIESNSVPPFYLNNHVYSCTLFLNSLPHRWRLAYNDDTDICLQVLADGWCTVLINAFLVDKISTMVVKGGNTTDLYQGDGRLRMARSLERMWPGVVFTARRFNRPQHVVKYAWGKFDTPLKLKEGIRLEDFEKIDERGMTLVEKKPVQSSELRSLVDAYKAFTD
jgi:hypothetical protein